MKNLYIIGGTMGVGKTTVCQILKMELPNSVFLDGDWCWDSHPFQVTEQTCALVLDNICHMLNNFLACSDYENVIFCWVMHKQDIIDSILSKLNSKKCSVKLISLVCSEVELKKRLEKDISCGIRTADIIGRSIARLTMYNELDTVKLDNTDLSPVQTAQAIKSI